MSNKDLWKWLDEDESGYTRINGELVKIDRAFQKSNPQYIPMGQLLIGPIDRFKKALDIVLDEFEADMIKSVKDRDKA